MEQDFLEQEIQRIDEEHKSSFSKMEVYKYNAFSDMGGETSFVIALLDHNNNGTLLNGMSSQNATYVYAKEIRNGASKVALSNEEKLTLENVSINNGGKMLDIKFFKRKSRCSKTEHQKQIPGSQITVS